MKESIAQEIIWYVRKDKRKGRIGIELINKFTTVCKKLGVARIIMIHMNNLNGNIMRRLYERRGFKEMERIYIKEV